MLDGEGGGGRGKRDGEDPAEKMIDEESGDTTEGDFSAAPRKERLNRGRDVVVGEGWGGMLELQQQPGCKCSKLLRAPRGPGPPVR